jgi:hypothetical protein
VRLRATLTTVLYGFYIPGYQMLDLTLKVGVQIERIKAVAL